MAEYRILIKPSAVKEIEDIPLKKDRQRIINRIRSLSASPRPPQCEKLSGQDKYRLRQGRYRIIYSINDQHSVVNVVKIGHRKDIYR
ncbi:MAG: type II toxin-antitoxin system RelE/ParE family toxin [Chloroflexota bacterium]|nr:type II toxin-antitoxin system RelE/ParE family toxin [Chloroflexota bacterium]